ncbi:MAG: murein biosynthesis integral membrane protein MurJ [Patescibacteria group bacterium]|jgi:putative peptidoglycan lipid II flippase
MIRKLFSASSTVASAAFIVGAMSLLSRIAGLVRDRVLIGAFNGQSGNVLDVYYQSFRLPDLFFQLLVVGAVSASFIPVFTRAWAGDDKTRAWKYANNVLHAVVLLFAVISAVAILGAPALAPLLAPGFTVEKQMAVAEMTRIIFLGQLFFAASIVFGSILQGTKRFFLPAFAPIVYNAGIILGALFIVPVVGPIGLAWGVVLGSCLHMLVQLIGAISVGYRYQPYLHLKDPDFLLTAKQTLPRVLGLAVNQIEFLLMSILATYIAAGAVRDLNLAYTLNFVPIGIVAVSYAIAAYPTFCERAAAKDLAGLRATFSLTMRQVMFFMIPATVLFLLLRAQIVRVVYGADGLDWPATISIADTLAIFALSFFAQAANFILVRVYYALEDTMTPFIFALLGGLLAVGTAVPLSQAYGTFGLAIAFSGSAMIQAAFLWVFLHHKIGGLDEKKILYSVFVFSLAGILSAFATQGAKYGVVKYITLDTFANVFLQFSVASVVGLGVYLLAAYFFKSPELRSITAGLQKKFLKAAQPAEVGDVTSAGT